MKEDFKEPYKFGLPPKVGLYDPQFEKDSCGVGLVANIKGIPSREIMDDAFLVNSKMDHRGGCGFEENTINEIPQCCYDEINKLVPLSNPEFNKCYDFETFGNHTYTKYNCDFAKLNETTTVEVFGFIGVVLLFILSVVIFVSLFRVCLRNNSYARV